MQKNKSVVWRKTYQQRNSKANNSSELSLSQKYAWARCGWSACFMADTQQGGFLTLIVLYTLKRTKRENSYAYNNRNFWSRTFS